MADAAHASVARGAGGTRPVLPGESGGEVFEFKAGCGGCQDAFELSTGDVILDTTPTEYIIDLSGQPAYGDVVGAFAWATDSAPIGASQTFYVDDLAWE